MASEIRVDKINSLSGVGTVTLSPTGLDIAGITTAATLRATTGIITSLTAGSLTSLGAVSGTTGTFSAAVSGTTGTFSGDIKTTAATVNVKSGSSINTNSDSAAHGALHKNTNSGEFAVVSGGTGGNNHLTFYTSASAAPTEKVRIDSTGRLLLNTTTEGNAGADDFTIGQISGSTGITIRSGTTNNGNLYFSDGTSGDDEYRGSIQYQHANNSLHIATNAVERLIIDSSGRMALGTNDASQFNSSADDFVISRAGHAGITIDSTSSHNSSVFFADGPTGSEAYRGYVQYSHNLDELRLGAAGADQVQITSGNVEIVDGDLVMGTSGHGISFAVTSDASGRSSELFDDYEEGTWTPTCVTGTLSYGHQSYTKIGRMVYINTYVNNFSDRSSSSAIEITGLPYAPANESDCGACVFYRVADTDEAQIAARTSTTGNKILFLVSSQGGSESWHHLTHSDLNHTNSQIKFSIWYAVA